MTSSLGRLPCNSKSVLATLKLVAHSSNWAGSEGRGPSAEAGTAIQSIARHAKSSKSLVYSSEGHCFPTSLSVEHCISDNKRQRMGAVVQMETCCQIGRSRLKGIQGVLLELEGHTVHEIRKSKCGSSGLQRLGRL